MSITTRYTVTGMTCEHCVASVTEEVEDVPGVTDVEVSLDTGDLTVTSTGAVDVAAVREAVSTAGYELHTSH